MRAKRGCRGSKRGNENPGLFRPDKRLKADVRERILRFAKILARFALPTGN